MSLTWQSDELPDPVPITRLGWIRVIWRASALSLGMILGLVVLWGLRLPEWALHGAARPWTPYVVQSYCRFAMFILGIRQRVIGQPVKPPGAAVANHSSWFDIITLNAALRVTFVSKAEVAGWPGIGFIAKSTGTRFITRRAREVGAQRDLLQDTLRAGHVPLFFPEGTSTDGARVLPFRSSLFAALFAEDLRDQLKVQPISVVYHAPKGQDRRFYAWWGDMDFGSHALKLMAAPRHGRITIVCHSVVRAGEFPDRKALAQSAEQAVRSGFEAHQSGA